MENQNSNLGLNLPTNPQNGATPFNQFSPYLPPPKPTIIAEPTLWERCLEFLNSKKIIETLIWLLLLILFVPSGMAVASWNAVPGDFTYSWKTGLEKGLLLVLKPSKTLQTSAQVALTQRRYAEAAKLLKGDQAQLGLKNLSSQVETTASSIQSLSASSSKTEFTAQYIEALTDLNQKLEEEKKQHQGSGYRPTKTAQNRVSRPTTNTAQPGTQTNGGIVIQNTYVQNTIIQTVTGAPGTAPITAPQAATAPQTMPETPESVDELTTEINETQQQIQDTIAALQTQAADQPFVQPTVPPAPNPTAVPAPKQIEQESAAPKSQSSPAESAQPAVSSDEPKSDKKDDEVKDEHTETKDSDSNSGSPNSGSGN